MVVDDELLRDVESLPGSKARFAPTFRSLLAHDADFDAAVDAWIGGWSASLGDRAPEARMRIDELLTCPWLRRSPENACSRDCSTCQARHFDPSAAPLSLIALVYRPDLQGHPDLEGAEGEARLVFGPADRNAPLTLSVEVPLPPGASDWPRRFHELGTTAREDLAARLMDLVDDVLTSRGRLRTSFELDATSAPMHEFAWSDNERLDPVPLERVPRPDVDSGELARYLEAHEECVLLGEHRLPLGLRAPFADARLPAPVPAVADDLLAAFQLETCNGCHRGSRGGKERVFHIDPRRRGEDKLSSFLSAGDGEIAARRWVLGDQLCEPGAEAL
jgi:hypothetical protein